MLELCAETITDMKQHIHRKRVQFKEIESIKKHLVEGQLLIHLDYSENYKAKHQNEIQSAYFGGKTFTLFTACIYYKEDGRLNKMSVTVTTEASDKSRSTSIGCINEVIEYAVNEIDVPITKLFIASDGCSAQFRSKFVFRLLLDMQPDLDIEWHYNEAHHGKGPMDGIGGTIKNVVYRRVMAGDLVINTPEEFATKADELSHSIKCLYLPSNEIPNEPSDIADAPGIAGTQTGEELQCRKDRILLPQQFPNPIPSAAV